MEKVIESCSTLRLQSTNFVIELKMKIACLWQVMQIHPRDLGSFSILSIIESLQTW